MKKIILVIVALSYSVPIFAASLGGIWQSDKEKTLGYASKNLKIDETSKDKLSLILGHNFISYNKENKCSFFEKFKVNDRVNKAYSAEPLKFKIIAKNEFGFVIEEFIESNHTSIIYMLIFESEESMYGVNLSTEDYGHPGIREYYKKVNTKTAKEGLKEFCPKH